MLVVGAPLLLVGLLLETEMNLLLAVALFAGLTILFAVVRVLWRPSRRAEGSPWWGLAALVLVLVPIGFAAELGPSSMVAAGGLLFAEGVELVGRPLRSRPAARA